MLTLARRGDRHGSLYQRPLPDRRDRNLSRPDGAGLPAPRVAQHPLPLPRLRADGLVPRRRFVLCRKPRGRC